MSFDDKTIQEFKDLASLRLFSESQHRTINELSRRITELEHENAHLKSLLETTTELPQPLQLLDTKPTRYSALTIIDLEIEKLKGQALEKPLTFEQTKRLDILVKNLLSLTEEKDKKGKKEEDSKPLNVEDLLKIVEGE